MLQLIDENKKISASFSHKKRWFCMGIMFLGLQMLNIYQNPIPATAVNQDTDTTAHEIYAEDRRLKQISHETTAYDKEHTSFSGYLYHQYAWVTKSYDEEERAGSCHARFDEQNRLLYALGYSPNILNNSNNYCEENIYERDDDEHTCRYIYYKANSAPYQDGYCIAYRYMFEASDFQFDEEGRLLRGLSYRRDVGSDPNGYSEELFFSRGYQAEYDGEQLMEELQYTDFWGSNETGVWEHRFYQYDERGRCILAVVTTEEEILLSCYEYHEDTSQVEAYTYQVTDNWEFTCEDGSTYYLRPDWGKPAVQKVAADGSVEQELFYGKAMDLGQQHYLMPEEVEDTLTDHMYLVKPGDCLWKIAYQQYGHGAYYDLIYRMNREVIGRDRELLLPGVRLYIPEVGNAQDTIVRD